MTWQRQRQRHILIEISLLLNLYIVTQGDTSALLNVSLYIHFFFFVGEIFRKRKSLSVAMPNSSPHLRSLHYDGCDDSDPFSDLPHRVLTQAPNNEHRNRRMNTRRLLESIPERERDMERDSDQECKLRARKGYDRRSGRPVMVFKRSGPARKKQPCGMPNCPTCGVFWRKCSSVVLMFEASS
jgi:hypothetical protein